MRVYLARHGQSQANLKNVMDNRPPGPELTDLGIEQAHNLGHQLKGSGVGRVWGSTLRRAEETARYAAEVLGLPYSTHAGLLEFDCGSLEGKGDEASWAEHWRVDGLWALGCLDERTGGGESLGEIQQRFWAFLNGLEEVDALVVAHGGVFRVALPGLLGLPAEFSRAHPLANTGLIVTERGARGWKCLEWGGVRP